MKNEAIREYVLSAYLATGRHVFVADVAKQFGTSALGVRNALGFDDFVFEHADRWTGSNFSGRYVLAPCVEPTKTYLAKIINSLRGTK
jgi:hypothetical protein